MITREKPCFHPEFEGNNPDRDIFIYKARRQWNWSIGGIACASGLSDMRIRQIIAEGDRLLDELRNQFGGDLVVKYPFEDT